MSDNNIVLMPMCADLIHVGHINILNTGAEHGEVTVALMTDDAMRKYKREPKMPYEERANILSSLKQVSNVVQCHGPDTYVSMIEELQPAVFVHGDDWKVGPQAEARLACFEAVKAYGGRVLEPAYTAGVSSTAVQEVFSAEIDQARHRGVLIRTTLNDCKRTPEVVERETNIDQSVMERLISGNDLDVQNVEAIVRVLARTYPVPLKHLIVDRDTSTDGVWTVDAAATEASARIFERTNANGDTTPYYRYMDTATSALAPFKPELIEELVVVEDNEPMNPLVVMNRGHLLAQLTFFVGEVNFYCTVRGERQCKVMNTGDSCLITPYVPHSFAKRDPNGYGAIVAVTFSTAVRDVLPDLVHHNITDVMAFAGTARAPRTVLARKIERYAELKGMVTTEELRAACAAAGMTEDEMAILADVTFAVDNGLSNEEYYNGEWSVNETAVAKLAGVLNIKPGALAVYELESDEEVTYQDTCGPDAAPGHYAFASSKHMADVGGYEWVLAGAETLTSQFFNYVYNYGETSVTLAWGEGETAHTVEIGTGDSYVTKPFVAHTVTAAEGGAAARLIVVKVPGIASSAVMDECALFANEGLQRMSGDTTKWW